MHRHADDFGLNESANDAIAGMLSTNDLTSVSVIVTSEAFKHIKNSLKDIKVPIFLHANVTEGRPLIANQKSSLIDETGHFYSQTQYLLRCILGKVKIEDLQAEIYEQYRVLSRYCKVVGVDSHQHAHSCEPFSGVLCGLARKHSLTLRGYKELNALSFGAKLVKSAYFIFALLSARFHIPKVWQKESWQPYMMCSWEKCPSRYDGILVTHPGTDFDSQKGIVRRIAQHLRYVKM